MLVKSLDKLYVDYTKSEWSKDTDFSDYAGISRGLWQGHYGFYRRSKCKSLKKSAKKKG